MRDSAERQYSESWLQYERPQQMYDEDMNKFYDNFYKINPIHNVNLDQQFKNAFVNWLNNHTLNKFLGLEQFERLDIINGCTQFLDDIYQRVGTDNVMIFKNDYKYHYRLNYNIQYTSIETLKKGKELIISMPFPFYGDIHPQMDDILDRCLALKIPVHIDGAWISCIKDIQFDFGHPAISTVGISLSKGGMGGNRIGVRFAKSKPKGAVTIMNDFWMNSQALVSMGTRFVETFGPEYYWKKYNDKYYKVCNDFNLTPTKAIHIALKNGTPVGIRPLLRCLNNPITS